MTKRSSRTARAEHVARATPEWIVFGVSSAILTAVVAVLVVLAFSSHDPAAPVAGDPGVVQQVGAQFYVPIEVTNRGDDGATQVQVTAELVIDGKSVSADQVIDVLGGGEKQRITFVFDDDPATGELHVTVTGFAEP